MTRDAPRVINAHRLAASHILQRSDQETLGSKLSSAASRSPGKTPPTALAIKIRRRATRQ